MSHHNQRLDRGVGGRLLRLKYRNYYVARFPRGTPKWWRKLHMTRPKRRENALYCFRVMKGEDPEGMAFPLGNCKPHVYYW